MWISVELDGVFREIERLPDTGPIAWKDVAVLIPVPQHGDSMRVRLSFVTDNWRIDQVAFAVERRSGAKPDIPVGSFSASLNPHFHLRRCDR
jgi:hypothetical protein